MSQRKAVHVSLLGIDGAGKTSVANALAHYVREKGRDAHIVSWKHVIPVPGYVPGVTLSSISMAAYKLQFSAATPLSNTCDLPNLLHQDSVQEFFQVSEPSLRDSRIGSNSAYPFISAAMLEIAGNFYLHHAHIRSLMMGDCVVIEESSGFKHAVKNALLAIRLAEGSQALLDEAHRIIKFASQVFGVSLKPDAGFWVDADPHLAVHWRAKSGVLDTNFENYGLAGDASASFLEMQTDCRTHFLEFAERWSWTRIHMPDKPKDANVQVALDRICTTIALL